MSDDPTPTLPDTREAEGLHRALAILDDVPIPTWATGEMRQGCVFQLAFAKVHVALAIDALAPSAPATESVTSRLDRMNDPGPCENCGAPYATDEPHHCIGKQMPRPAPYPAAQPGGAPATPTDTPDTGRGSQGGHGEGAL